MGGLMQCCRKTKTNYKKNLGLNQMLIEDKMNIYSATRDGQKKDKDQTGQDAFDIITFELGPNIKYIAVYDGHGVNGKEAAQYAKEQIRKQIIKQKKVLINLKDRKEAETFFTKIFNKIQNKFRKKAKEYQSSGSCVIAVLIIDSHCFIINLGDSRAVIGLKQADNLVACQMSIDQKANRDDERKRIELCGGIVSSERNGNIGIPRVYSAKEEGPGLAISRTLGDLFGHTVGISAEPEVSYKELDDKDKFIIIGSDGVWDVMNSSEATGYIFSKAQDSKEKIAEYIVDECRIRWEVLNLYGTQKDNEKKNNLIKNDINSVNRTISDNRQKAMIIDDITAVICFFNLE